MGEDDDYNMPPEDDQWDNEVDFEEETMELNESQYDIVIQMVVMMKIWSALMDL